jgi:hypothetical protein
MGMELVADPSLSTNFCELPGANCVPLNTVGLVPVPNAEAS